MDFGLELRRTYGGVKFSESDSGARLNDGMSPDPILIQLKTIDKTFAEPCAINKSCHGMLGKMKKKPVLLRGRYTEDFVCQKK